MRKTRGLRVGKVIGGARRTLVALILCAPLFVAAPARADAYDPQRAGHPLRIVAYALHPIGVILEWTLLRPAHWIGSHEPFQTLFGHRETE